MIIASMEDLAAYLEAAHDTEESISRRVYKMTSCGAWASILRDGDLGTPLGVQFGSIVEGSDAEVVADALYFPCSSSSIDKAIEHVEERADAIWRDLYEEEWCSEEAELWRMSHLR